MNIVKKLHLTLPNKQHISNPIWQECLNQYRALYTDFEIIIYDNNDIYKIIEQHYPEYLAEIKKIKVGAVLADVFRYLILYLEGGIYSDMDCLPLKRIDSLLGENYYHGDLRRNNSFYIYPPDKKLLNRGWDFYRNPCDNCRVINVGHVQTFKCLGHRWIKDNTKVILGYEFHKDWHHMYGFLKDPKQIYREQQICQWFMISQPKQEIFLEMFLSCIKKLPILINLTDANNRLLPGATDTILWTSGPRGFTKVVLEYLDKNPTTDIVILPNDVYGAGSYGSSTVPITRNSVIRHKFTGSWRRGGGAPPPP